jgi:predicted glycosyltransferase
MFWRITRPFADYIVTPDTIPDDFGKKHIRYAGNQELAYLHPTRFTPDIKVLEELGISRNERYFLLRFVSLQASHDRGEQGLSLSMKKELIDTLSGYGRVFISSEGEVPPEMKPYQINIPPVKIHDILAFADLVIADSQSMIVEAAVLGIPSLRCNTFVGKTPVVDDLENRYELTYGFLPHQGSALLSKMETLIRDNEVKEKWAKKRSRLLAESIDLTSYMVGLVEDLQAKEMI